jgi:alpha-mannosidase
VVARGQTIKLPAGHYTRAYILAASANGDRTATFRVGSTPAQLVIEDWGGYVGQWDNRVWKTIEPTADEIAAFQQGQTRRREQLRARIDSIAKAGGDTASLGAQYRRTVNGGFRPRPREEFTGLTPGYIKPASIAWYASHKHTADGANEYYSYSYLFAYPIDLPAGATSITLPSDDSIRVMAVTVSDEPAVATPAASLHDTLGRK